MNEFTALRLLIFKFLYFFHQGRNQFFFRHAPQDFSFSEEEAAAFAAGYAEVCFSGFARTIDSAAHDSYADGLLEFLDFLFHFLSHMDEVHLGAAAGGAGNEDGTVLLHAHGAQDLFGGLHFFQRVIGEGDTDGIANAVQKEAADADVVIVAVKPWKVEEVKNP